MKVLLIQPPLEDFYTTPIRLYPLGLLYAAGVLEAAGAQVEILDALSPLRKRRIPVPASFGYLPALESIPHFFKGYYRFGLPDGEILRRVRASAPDLIGISSQFTAYFESVERLARLIKREVRAPVFIGGHHATVFAPEIRRRTPEIDFVLEGPAEECLPPFLKSLGMAAWAERPPAGATHLDEGIVLDWRTVQPAHHLLKGAGYRIGRKNSISLIASRGCPYRCEFCGVHRMFGRKIEYRDVDAVIEEMRRQRDLKGARVFNFEDDNLSFDREWFMEFLRTVAADSALRGVELTAMNGLCHSTLDSGGIEAMKRAGFRELNVSLVTASPKLQETYHRPYKIDGFDKFCSLIKEARRLSFFVTAYVIIGLPGQTFAEAKATIDELLALDILVGPSVFYMAPGSPMLERLDIPSAIKEDWNLYRSAAFAVETPELSRTQLLELFSYARQKNLERKNH